MKEQLDESLGVALSHWVEAVRRRAGLVAAGIALATLPIGLYAALNLGMNTDSVTMVGEDLPARKNHDAFAALFPNLEHAILIVVDAASPELARSSAEALVDALSADDEHFTEVYLPGGGDFFERNGLLYRSLEDLEEFADQMAMIQPVLAEIERDPSLSNLTSLIETGLEQVRSQDGAQALQWADVLDRVGQATVRVYDEFPLEVSWEELLLRGSAIEITTRRVVIAHPILDFDSFLAASGPLHSILGAAESLGLTPERGVEVRVTGNPVLNYEEMIGLAWDIGGAGVFCFALVALLLTRALRSFRLALASILTLLVGLVWTAAWAAVSVGRLNVASMAFAILFIGLGVDFCIHLGSRYAELLRSGLDEEGSLREATRSVGSSLVICAFTTAVGFFVFVPTPYLGIAELGMISGGGMIVILFLSLTFFPALVCSVVRVDPQRDLRAPVTFHHHWWAPFARHPAAVRWTALGLAVGAAVLVPYNRFDPNAVNIRDPDTPSVQAFQDLLAETGRASPWYIDTVAADLDAADRLARELDELPVVSATVTLRDYVPVEQEEKLALLEDVAFLLDPTGAMPVSAEAEPDPERQVEALRTLYRFLDEPWLEELDGVLAESIRHLRGHLAVFLPRVERDGQRAQALATLEDLLLAGLPDQVVRLRRATSPSPIDLEALPAPLRKRMLAADGQARVQIFPTETMQDEASFERFTDGVREVAPRATGIAVNLIELGRACQRSFRQALASALGVIALVLLLMWRSLRETALVMAPLLLAALLTVAAMVALDMPFNFVNILVIPLLFGIGVDSAIHLVHRSRLLVEGEALLETTSARAVLYSALTTTVSFGSLALSSHRGMETLGVLLVICMLLTVAANLIVLPALLAWQGKR